MSLRVYNTLSGNKEVFEPVRPGHVGIYLCGPTVYKPSHIGHMVGPLIFDAITRYLKFKGYQVTLIVNITDVDDKIIDRAKELKTDWMTVADDCTKQYFECLALLGIDSINQFPKASVHMPEIIEMTQKLIAQGNAYPADGNVWFDVTKDAGYGKLSHRRLEDQESGTRELTGSGKRNPADFALWKAAKPGEPSWNSPWGAGRPGWHIECSAMSMKYLGETFDMHGGGMDLMFPHHENELAQSECCTGKPFAKYWMHNGLTRMATKLAGGQIKSEKMSKSLGNVLDPKKLVADHGADLVRYLLLSTHYRRPIDFSDEVVVASKKGISTFFRLFERVDRLTGVASSTKPADMSEISTEMLDSENAPFAKDVIAFKMKFLEMMDDDFNTAGAIGVMHELAGLINGYIEETKAEKEKQPDVLRSVAAATQTLRSLGGLLGLFRGKMQTSSEDAKAGDQTLEQVMQLVIRLRNEARKTKNFALADAIRNGLTEIGITMEDRADVTSWRKN
jgi:cysteinyl-tRNA synthetase